jgi:hypothetical protein
MLAKKFLVALLLQLALLDSDLSSSENAPAEVGVRMPPDKISVTGFLRVAGNPQKYDKTRVGVTGVLGVTHWGCQLFNSTEDKKHGRIENSFLLGWTELDVGKWTQEWDGKFIYVEGVFNAPKEGEDEVPYGGYLFELNFAQHLNE